VLLIGDSNIEARFLREKSQLPGQVLADSINGRHASASSPCFQVDTFGVEGFGPDQAYFALEDLTRKKNYDVVVFHVFADNDIGDLLRGNYARDEHGLVNDGYCYARPSLIESFKLFKAFRRVLYLTTGHWIGTSVPVASKPRFENCVNPMAFDQSGHASNRLDATRLRADEDKAMFAAGKRQNYKGDRYDIEIACGVEDDFTRWEFQQLVTVFNQLSDLSKARGFRTVILLEPSEWDMTFNQKENPKTLAKFCPGYAKLNIVDFIKRSVSHSRFDGDVVSLADDFDGCSECYFSEAEMGPDDHWSPVGIGRAMRILANSAVFK
jgi:hypothetical protein